MTLKSPRGTALKNIWCLGFHTFNFRVEYVDSISLSFWFGWSLLLLIHNVRLLMDTNFWWIHTSPSNGLKNELWDLELEIFRIWVVEIWWPEKLRMSVYVCRNTLTHAVTCHSQDQQHLKDLYSVLMIVIRRPCLPRDPQFMCIGFYELHCITVFSLTWHLNLKNELI